MDASYMIQILEGFLEESMLRSYTKTVNLNPFPAKEICKTNVHSKEYNYPIPQTPEP